MQKATITILSGQNKTQTINVMFNPSEYSISRNMNYAEVGVPGLSMPLLQFVRGEAQVLTLELFLDSSDRPGASPGAAVGAATGSAGAGSISLTANGGASTAPVPTAQWKDLGGSPFCEHRLLALRRLAEIDSELHAPPVVRFSWASNRFEGVVTTYTEKFTMFDDKGNIVRARVSLSLKSYIAAEDQLKNINPQSPDRTKTHVVQAGDRLDSIAADEYGDPEQWRVIASANNITRPRMLTPGTLLTIPPLT